MKNYKITISGWPGAGSSTLALLLSYTLKLKLYQGGEVFRFFFRKIESETGLGRIQGNAEIEPIIGSLYDKYIDTLVPDKTKTNILIESDIASFRLGKVESVISIFLVASQESRKARTQVDGRAADGDQMLEIDKTHEEEYRKLHNINWFDLNEIEQKHNLVIHNDNLTIAEELDIVYEKLYKTNIIDMDKLKILKSNSKMFEEDFWTKGKSFFKEELKKQDLLMSGEEILTDMWKQFYDTMINIPEPYLSWIKEVVSKE